MCCIHAFSFCIYVGAILLPVSTPIHWYALSIFSQIDWRKAKKEKIHRIQDKYQKPNFPREIQASKLDESSAVLVALAESH